MPTSGTGTGTAIVCGIPGTAPSIALPLKRTLLSLPYYARIMGVNPVHFMGAVAEDVWPAGSNTCSDLWPRHSWQYTDHVSHEDLARAIYDAEEELARVIGYYPAPVWISQEVHRMSRHHRRDLYREHARNVRMGRTSVVTNYGKFIQGGQRAVSLVNTATTAGGSLAYSDEDGDGFAETATVQVNTTLTDECELNVYFTGTGGDMEWEIRPANSKAISGGVFTATFDSWLFIDPDTLAAHPTPAGFSAVDISDTSNYVTSVDVYREYNDYSAYGAAFYWDPAPRGATMSFCASCGGVGCPACSPSVQYGCVHARDNEAGVVVPVPATYDSDDAQWDQVAFDECRDPDQVKLWYYAGEYSNEWLSGRTCDPLSNFWAHTISWIATARLDRAPCQCGVVQAFYDRMREDLALVGERSHLVDPAILGNPFGTRRGEVMAWQRISQVVTRNIMGGAI